MTVSVRIPTILRTYTQDQSQVDADGATLAAVIDSLESSFPGIKARVVDEQGALRRFVNIYVGRGGRPLLQRPRHPDARGHADLDHPRCCGRFLSSSQAG